MMQKNIPNHTNDNQKIIAVPPT